MDEKESDALLREVISYCTDKSRAYFHSYELTDMVLWDNWRMLHCANGMPAGQRRHMRRTTIAGDYGLGRFEKASKVAGRGITCARSVDGCGRARLQAQKIFLAEIFHSSVRHEDQHP